MYLTENLANVLLKGYKDVHNRFEKMYNNQDDLFKLGFVIFMGLYIIMLFGSMGIIFYLLLILQRKFKFVYECYAKLKSNELELQRVLNAFCLHMFRVYKFNEKKLISTYLDHEVLYKEKEMEVKERNQNQRGTSQVYELQASRQLPAVKYTFIKSIGLALLFSMYIVILVLVQMAIYSRIDVDKFRSDVYAYKKNMDYLYLDFFYITTTDKVNVDYKEPSG